MMIGVRVAGQRQETSDKATTDEENVDAKTNRDEESVMGQRVGSSVLRVSRSIQRLAERRGKPCLT